MSVEEEWRGDVNALRSGAAATMKATAIMGLERKGMDPDQAVLMLIGQVALLNGSLGMLLSLTLDCHRERMERDA